MQSITREELEQMNDSGDRDFVLINVLPPAQFNEKHIRTSINIPLEDQDFTELVARVAGDRDRDVVVYCANAECDASPKAAQELDKAGFSSVFDYEGGTEDWLKYH